MQLLEHSLLIFDILYIKNSLCKELIFLVATAKQIRIRYLGNIIEIKECKIAGWIFFGKTEEKRDRLKKDWLKCIN